MQRTAGNYQKRVTRREAWDNLSLRASRKDQPCPHLDFRLLAPQRWEKYMSVVLSPTIAVICYSGAMILTHMGRVEPGTLRHLCISTSNYQHTCNAHPSTHPGHCAFCWFGLTKRSLRLPSVCRSAHSGAWQSPHCFLWHHLVIKWEIMWQHQGAPIHYWFVSSFASTRAELAAKKPGKGNLVREFYRLRKCFWHLGHIVHTESYIWGAHLLLKTKSLKFLSRELMWIPQENR